MAEGVVMAVINVIGQIPMSIMLPTAAGSQGLQQVSTPTSDTKDLDKPGDMVATLWHQMEDGLCR